MTRSNAAALEALKQAEILDGDMTPADILYTLEQLRFRNGLQMIKLDREVRDFLIRILRTKGWSSSCVDSRSGPWPLKA